MQRRRNRLNFFPGIEHGIDFGGRYAMPFGEFVD